ncbi:diacylglycerol kinase family protein [Gramella sp. KN1008]|uniref:diacylglycerol/lipid kinase family protein n=1 Tax=Gramella sp. KN1008 TaxID=2529298 RepID=UPI00103E2197|nr:YegS/Rv2252/BmrU family lipid kinase [Gramella sp. KN1008]TBW28956.1 YegS/Rv2252/BmrU family lipid kinase [Gramella sp. KN1008]
MTNFKEVLLVVNPIAGNTDKRRIISEVEEKLQEENKKFHLYSTTGEDDREKLIALLEQHDIDRIIVAGGDGTINLVADVLYKSEISMGIIPVGSANGLAVNLSLPETLTEQIDIALGDNYLDLDILSLNGLICLHMSDLGINAELIKNYENSSIRGKFGYLIQSIPTLIQSEFPFHFKIKADDYENDASAVLLGFANAKKYGTGANVNPEGEPNDGVFEILIFKKLSFSEILKTLRNETDLDPDFVEIIPTTSAKVICEKPVPFQIDGEYIGKKTDIEIKMLPEKLRVVVP